MPHKSSAEALKQSLAKRLQPAPEGKPARAGPMEKKPAVRARPEGAQEKTERKAQAAKK